jgi:hypothetical protein
MRGAQVSIRSLAGPTHSVLCNGKLAPETGSAYARARALCEELGDSVSLTPVLSGQISHHFGRPEYALAQRIAEDLLRLAQSRGDTASELPPFSNETKLIFMYSTLETRTFHQEDQTLSGFAPPQICHESDHDLYLK